MYVMPQNLLVGNRDALAKIMDGPSVRVAKAPAWGRVRLVGCTGAGGEGSSIVHGGCVDISGAA